jgi:hypothetical protein
MERYLHRTLGLYSSRAAADSAFGTLSRLGIAPGQGRIIEPGQGESHQEAKADSDDVLKELLRDGTIGAIIGTVVGAVGMIAMWIANISLFIASPVIAAATMLGWGASVGGLVGAAVGAQRVRGDVSDQVKNGLARGQVVLMAHTDTEEQTAHAQKIIGASMDSAPTPSETDNPPPYLFR